MTDVVHIDARWIVQLVLCSALLSAFAFVAFRSNPITRRAYTLIAGLVLTALPFALAMTSGWHWTAPFEVLTLVSLVGSVPIPVWLIVVWVTGAVVLTLRAVVRLVETRRELAALPTVDDARIEAEAAVVARRLAFDRPYRLHYGPNSCSSAMAGNRIVLQADARDWEPRAVRAVLAHEFVHLARRDDLCLFGLGLVLNWYWFAPWVSLLRQQYASAMEQSCDDRAAEILPSCADYLDGVLCAARAEQEPSIVAALAGTGMVMRFQRFLGSRERQLDVGGVYWGLVVGLGVALLFTSVEFEANERAPVGLIGSFQGMRTLSLEPRLEVPAVWEHALGGDRAVRRAPSPIYPGRAINEGLEGYVVVEYAVSRDGRVVRPTVVNSEPPGVFDEAVLRAVARREYVPSHELDDAGSANSPNRITRRFDFDLPDVEPSPMSSETPESPSASPPPSLPVSQTWEATAEVWHLAKPEIVVELAQAPVAVDGASGEESAEGMEETAVPKPATPKSTSKNHEETVAPETIKSPTVVSMPPVYPERAKLARIEGHVLVEFVVTETGAVRDASVVEAKPSGVFDQAALKMVSGAKFEPKTVGGKPVEASGVRTRIEFELPEPARY